MYYTTLKTHSAQGIPEIPEQTCNKETLKAKFAFFKRTLTVFKQLLNTFPIELCVSVVTEPRSKENNFENKKI